MERFDDLNAAFAWLDGLTNLERSNNYDLRLYRLDRTAILLRGFGDPHTKYKTIHLAGSKGKGSTAAYLSAILSEAGFVCGRYASPHLSSVTERYTVSEKPAQAHVLLAIINTIHRFLRAPGAPDLPGGPPTTYELYTLAAFLLFEQSGCQWAVIETGLGGRLDCTNVVKPEAVVFTPIELEHTEVLGSTLQAITREKAGIIKPGAPVFCAPQKKEVLAVLTEKAAASNCLFIEFDKCVEQLIVEPEIEKTGVKLKWFGEARTYRLSLIMPGYFQAQNSALAWLVYRQLFGRRQAAPQIIRALAKVKLPGRLEVVRWRDKTVIFDVAHTPNSLRQTINFTEEFFCQPKTLIFGAVKGKRIVEMAEICAPCFTKIIISRPGDFKASDPEEVFDCFGRLIKDRSTLSLRLPADQAWLEASNTTASTIVVAGSFYMVAAIRQLVVA